jgi:hypothetical protein
VIALRLALSSEAEQRQAHHSTADTGTDAWLAQHTGHPRATAASDLWLARSLNSTYAATREAFAAGQLRLDQVRVILSAAAKAPAGATPNQIREAEETLVGHATGATSRTGRPIDARRLRQVARRMFETISVEVAHQHESDLLQAEERRAARETWFSLNDNGDATWSGRFMIPELHGNLLRNALQRLTAPRRLARHRGVVVEDDTLPGEGGLNTTEWFGHGLCELIEHLPTAAHTGTTTEVVVTMDLDSLLTGIGVARLDTGVHISAGNARRLACEAGLVPLVLNGKSVPLDLGRRRRLHNRHQRRPLAALYDTCAIVSCERPFSWCEIHHLLPWARGGTTDHDLAAPLCGWHHRKAHDPQWELRHHGPYEFRFHRRS